MKITDIPTKFYLPFANQAGGSYITYPVPVDSQIGVQDGRASLTDGFPPLNFQAVEAGGIPPFGQDFNGVLKQTTSWTRWQNAGGTLRYDAAFAAAIGGYPKGAILASSTNFGAFWLCSADDNETDPDDAGTSQNWIGMNSTGFALVADVTGSTYTYSPINTGTVVKRSNSGTPMIDTVPGSSSGGVLPAGYILHIHNADNTALLAVKAGSGTSIGRARPFWIGPGQDLILVSDGANYFPLYFPSRCRMGTNTAFYVATTGDDNNPGITAASPWRTLQNGWNRIYQDFDLVGAIATINVAAGTYAEQLIAEGRPLGVLTQESVVFVGDLTTPANCIISPASGAAVVSYVSNLKVSGFKVLSADSDALLALGTSSVLVYSKIEFGASAAGYHVAARRGATCAMIDNCSITGAAAGHFLSEINSQINVTAAKTITITGTLNFSDAFAVAKTGAIMTVPSSTTFSGGTVTGTRYSASLNAVINTSGGGATFFPGNAGGATATGGQYA